MNIKYISLVLFTILTPWIAAAKILPNLVDQQGNPVHTRDEFTLSVNTTISSDPSGYRYTYDLSNDVLSNQAVWMFDVFLNDSYSMIQGSSNSPWGQGAEPNPLAQDELWAKAIRWNSDPSQINPLPIMPGTTILGFTFLSPYPPGIIKYYAEGHGNYPWVPAGMAPIGGVPAFSQNSPYGPGKVMPVIGPVKPSTPNVIDNYSVVGCVGGICDVQLDITGPMDPYGTAYTYTWTGAFGTTFGAKPLVQLAAGTYQVSVAVSDPYATLVTATMPITVIDPNPPVVVNPPADGGNAGGGNAGGGQGNVGGGNAGGGNAGGGNNYSPYNNDDSSGDNSSGDASSDNQSDDDESDDHDDSESN